MLCLGDPAGIVPQEQSHHQLQQDLDEIDTRVGQSWTQLWPWVLARQLRWKPLGLPASGMMVESAPLHACPQSRFLLALGDEWGPSLRSAGSTPLGVVGSKW